MKIRLPKRLMNSLIEDQLYERFEEEYQERKARETAVEIEHVKYIQRQEFCDYRILLADKLKLTDSRERKKEINLLSFQIMAVAEDLSISLIRNHMKGRLQYTGYEPFPCCYTKNGIEVEAVRSIRKNVKINEVCLLAYPRETGRLHNIIETIANEGFIYHPDNHIINFYEGIGVGFVEGGRHSMSVGIVMKQGAVDMRVYQMDCIFDAIEVDSYGEGYRFIDDHKQVGCPIVDIRIAYIYELARCRYLLGKPYEGQTAL